VNSAYGQFILIIYRCVATSATSIREQVSLCPPHNSPYADCQSSHEPESLQRDGCGARVGGQVFQFLFCICSAHISTVLSASMCEARDGAMPPSSTSLGILSPFSAYAQLTLNSRGPVDMPIDNHATAMERIASVHAKHSLGIC